MRELLHETFIATNGSGPELARLFESARLLVDEANANYPQVSQLIDQAGPFLQAQIRAGADIKSLSDGLARFTSEVRQADPQLRYTLATAPGATDEANTAFSGIRPSFPALAASLANLGRVGVIYHKSIEQLLVVLPALFAAITTAAGGVPQDEGAKLDFKLDLNDPPPCAVGFLPPPLMRTPADETLRELPRDMYCKVAQNDPEHRARRAQLSVPGVPRQTGADRFSSAVTRRAMCRSAATRGAARRSLRHAGDQRAERVAAQQVPVYPAGRRTRSRHGRSSGRRPPGVVPGPGPAAEPAGFRSAAAQRQWAAARQPVVDAAGGPAGAAPASVSEVAPPAATAGGDQSSAAGPGTGEAVGAAARPATAGQRTGICHL